MNKILVVDDSLVVRSYLRGALEREDDLEVVGTASNGRRAIAQVEALAPDLVVMDVNMPVLDGITALELLRRSHPRLPAIVFTSAELDPATGMRLLAMPHTAVLSKTEHRSPGSTADEEARQVLVTTVRQLLGIPHGPVATPPDGEAAVADTTAAGPPGGDGPRREGGAYRLLVLGASTGGPDALSEVFSHLPEAFPVPVLLAQHMPAEFTRHLALRLDACSPLRVSEGRQGAPLRAGLAYVAPGGSHMVVGGSRAAPHVAINEAPPRHACRPAVDPLFESAAEVYGDSVLAAVLTGMGSDGAAGAGTIRAAGGTVLIQDEASSVVWGMPGAVHRAGAADEVLPLGGLAAAIIERLTRGPRRAELPEADGRRSA